jgi:DNA polymerase-3 subunit alpha
MNSDTPALDDHDLLLLPDDAGLPEEEGLDEGAEAPVATAAVPAAGGPAAGDAGPAFVHLHVHSDYSMLDGACQIGRLCERTAALGQKAVAITDHGNMFGALDLYRLAPKHGLRPIIGCEFYMTGSTLADHSDATRYHLVLLAKDYTGYQTLCQLSRYAWSDDGLYYKPRLDRETLRQHHEHLICLSACIAGEIPDFLLKGREDRARDAIAFFIGLFGKEDFFLELQYHAAPGTSVADLQDAEHRELLLAEQQANRALIRLAREYGIGVVATNDVHYLEAGDHVGHDALLCIGTQSQLADAKRLRFPGDQFYLKSGSEMAAVFADCPEAVANSVRIAERCDVRVPLGQNHYPVFRLADGSDHPTDLHCPVRKAFLRRICLEALPDRYALPGPDNPRYVPRSPAEPDPARRQLILQRLDFELDVIDRMGYVSYFLVVWDFIRYARSRGIPVGPGRGSGAGSIVAYLARITDLDPLQYGLLFERFLNPDRVSPPDFDIDFCERRRGEVLDYVRGRYGAGSVAQIGTFGTLKAKAVLRDVARVMGVPFADANRLVALIPTDPKMTLAKALAIPEVRALHDSTDWVRQVFERGKVLEGLNRNQSIHACGVVIGDQPLDGIIPLARGAGREWITQFPAAPCEELGLLKMDLLGLKTLTIIDDALEMVNARASGPGPKLTPETIPPDDRRTYELLNRGQTVGVFQLESGGMQDLCRSFAIGRLEEIIALVALYRPGPMEFIPTYIQCKLGREAPEYETPEMRELLSETYGIMVYQEQIMQVCQAVAGFSLAQADVMRRAIGKKKEKDLVEYGGRFCQGVVDHGGYSREVGESIWAKVLRFASYGFNKSHSACYALLSYRTAYLKANHPAEFMAAVLNSELGNAEKLAFYIAEARHMGLRIMPPDVNHSLLRFGVSDGVIRFGLGAIKGVGSGAAEAIIAQRQAGGPFPGLLGFCERVDAGINRRVLENLAKAGAFDSLGWKRSQTSALLDEAMQRAQHTLSDRRSGQRSLFDLLAPEDNRLLQLTPPDIPEWDRRELLSYEKELLGFYVTGHPTDQVAELLQTYQTESIAETGALADGTGTRIGGIISHLEVKRSKRDNRPWAILTLEGREAEIECLVYSDRYAECADVIAPDALVFVEGSVTRREEEPPKVTAERVLPLARAPELFTAEVHLRLHEKAVTKALVAELAAVCRAHPGRTPVTLCLVCGGGEIAFVQADGLAVTNSEPWRHGVRRLLGDECLVPKADLTRPKARERRAYARAAPENGVVVSE